MGQGDEGRVVVRHRRLAMTALMVAGLGSALVIAPAARAGELAIAITAESAAGSPPQLLVFDTDAPDEPLIARPVLGLLVSEAAIGLDLRPATGEVWVHTSIGRTLILHPDTGELIQVDGQLDQAVFQSNVENGLDFNPTVDRLRFANTAGQNLRFNPVTFAPVDSDVVTVGLQVDSDLAFIATDPNVGAPVTLVAAAYDRSDNDAATATTLFGIDSTLDIFVRQGAVDGNGADVPGGGSPNGGLVTTLGALGVDVTDVVSFDIAPGPQPIANEGKGVAFMVAQVAGETGSTLFQVQLPPAAGELAVGEATAIGTILSEPITGFALLTGGGLGAPDQPTQVSETSGEATITVSRRGGTLAPTLVGFRTADRTAVAGQDYTATSGVLFFAAGQVSADVAVELLADDVAEGAETFALELGPASGGAMVLAPDHTVELASEVGDDDADAGPGAADAGSGGDDAGDEDGGGCGCEVPTGRPPVVPVALALSALLILRRRRPARGGQGRGAPPARARITRDRP